MFVLAHQNIRSFRIGNAPFGLRAKRAEIATETEPNAAAVRMPPPQFVDTNE